MSELIVQVGFSNSARERQKIKATHNGDTVTWVKTREGYNGEFATPLSQRQKHIWFLAKLDASPGDILAVTIEVFIAGLGFDEDRSRTLQWSVGHREPIEYTLRKVGDPHFPIVHGPLDLIFDRALIDARRDKAHMLYPESS